MKVLVLNDTSIENHHGCSRVMNAIDRNLSLRGVTDVSYIPMMYPWELDEDLKRAIVTSDQIIINGEGTLHGDRPHVSRLLAVTRFATAYQIPVSIINATIFNLGDMSIELLKLAFTIFVRDKASQEYLESRGVFSRYCPDLTFWNADSIEDTPRLELCAVSESLFATVPKGQFKGKLIPFSIKNTNQNYWQSSFLRKRLINVQNLLRSLRISPELISTDNQIEFLNFLSKCAMVITDRYHVVCMSLYCETPFQYVDGNTPKTTFLLRDVGLDVKRFRYVDPQLITYSGEERRAIKRFKLNAQQMITMMFDDICLKKSSV